MRKCETLVSAMRLNREMTKIIRGTEDAKVVVFPRSVRKIGGDSFYKMKSLRQVVVNEGLETLDEKNYDDFGYNGPFAHSSVEQIRLPSTLKKLGNYAFNKCEKLNSVKLQEGLETIGNRCFEECCVQELHIPASVREIGEKIVNFCDNLKSITFAENG